MQTTSSNPSGTKIQTTSHNLGEPAVHETRYYDAQGNQILEGGRVLGQSNAGAETRRIEDVTDEHDGEMKNS